MFARNPNACAKIWLFFIMLSLTLMRNCESIANVSLNLQNQNVSLLLKSSCLVEKSESASCDFSRLSNCLCWFLRSLSNEHVRINLLRTKSALERSNFYSSNLSFWCYRKIIIWFESRDNFQRSNTTDPILRNIHPYLWRSMQMCVRERVECRWSRMKWIKRELKWIKNYCK